MLLVLIIAICYPFIARQSKFAALKGSVVGILLAVATGLFMPSGTIRTTALTPIQCEKEWLNADEPIHYNLVVADEKNQIRHLALKLNQTTLTINTDPEQPLCVYSGRNTFESDWMWLVAFKIPHERYEIAFPKSMTEAVTAADTYNKRAVFFSNTAYKQAYVDAKTTEQPAQEVSVNK